MMTCKRCLLMEDAAQRDLARLLREYIALLPEAEKASGTQYRARLEQCKACDALGSGTCGLCGCYVEARAAKARQRCPAPVPRW